MERTLRRAGEGLRRLGGGQGVWIVGLAILCVLTLAAGGGKQEAEETASTALERRLERVLSAVEGAGEVRVMIREREGEAATVFSSGQEAGAEGVLIVCEGAESLRVRLALEQAAQALLGVDYSRIQVVKMEGGGG